MSNGVEFVDCREPITIKVAKFLLSKGFGIANSVGIAHPLDSIKNAVGILYRDPELKPRKYLFGLIKREPQRMFLGVIWFRNYMLGANEQNLIFEAYGHKYIKRAKQLAKEITLTFKVKITLRLTCEEPRVELFLSDLDPRG